MSSIDRVVYIAKGRVAVDTPEEVISSETLSKLYGSNVEVLRTGDGSCVVVDGRGDNQLS